MGTKRDNKASIRKNNKNKWINHKCELQSGASGMARQEILIHLQNMIGYPKFLMGYPSFWHNSTYEPFCVFNRNKH